MRFLKYLGSDYILGEIIGESHDGFYWYVRPMPDKKRPVRQKKMCHPKWCTEIISEDDLSEV